VSEADPLLDRADIERAFRRLGERLARRGLTADVYVIGGAALAMAYDSRRATRDIDAVFEPHGAVIEEVLHGCSSTLVFGSRLPHPSTSWP